MHSSRCSIGVSLNPESPSLIPYLLNLVPVSRRLLGVTSVADIEFFFYTYFRLQVIDSGVSWGSHYVECELVGEEGDRNLPSFRILGIFAT